MIHRQPNDNGGKECFEQPMVGLKNSVQNERYVSGIFDNKAKVVRTIVVTYL